MMSGEKGKLLLLGGTGFVGSEILRYATGQGYKVVALSRRGSPPSGAAPSIGAGSVEWRAGNAIDPTVVPAILAEGGFTGVIHAVGMLFEGDLNRLASGSGSVPTPGSTYDDVTRKTALNALAAVTAGAAGAAPAPPFAFVSAAEASWTFDGAFEGTPLAWLRRYLVAKRAVEDALLGAGAAGRRAAAAAAAALLLRRPCIAAASLWLPPPPPPPPPRRCLFAPFEFPAHDPAHPPAARQGASAPSSSAPASSGPGPGPGPPPAARRRRAL